MTDSKDSEIDLREIFLTLRTNLKLMVVTALLAAFAALLFCLSVTPLYTGTVNLVVDPRRLQIFGVNQNRQDNSVLSDAPIDNNTIDSFVSTLTAETVLARVVKKLDLVSDPEFNGSDKSVVQVVLGPILSLLRSADAPTEDQKTRSVINALNKRLKIVRAGTSYNIEISFDATTPRKAATIANSVADAFIEDQLASNVGTLQRASVWLEERLKDLRDKVATADLAVLKFRQDNQVDQSTRSRELQVQLRTLDSLAQSYRSLYDTLLQRYNFAVEQQSFPSEVARVVTRAVPSNEKSFPKTFVFLAIAFVGGLGGGAFFAIVRSIFDSSIRTRAALGSVTHVECLALIPDLRRGQPFNPKGRRLSARVSAAWRNLITSISLARRRLLGKPNVPMKWQDFVASISADGSKANQIPPELLQRAKLVTDASDGPKTVSFLSCLPGEGKTVCNIAFARLLSRSGAKVLLIDADLKRPSATALMSGPIAARFADSMPENEERVQAVDVEGDRFYFLPLVKERIAEQPTQTLLARDIPALLTRAREVFDYVIVDLPPIGLTSDAGLLEPGIDGFFLVVKWGSTTNETIARSLSSSRAINRKLFGAVLNQVDITWLSRAERDPSIVMTYPYAY